MFSSFLFKFLWSNYKYVILFFLVFLLLGIGVFDWVFHLGFCLVCLVLEWQQRDWVVSGGVRWFSSLGANGLGGGILVVSNGEG